MFCYQQKTHPEIKNKLRAQFGRNLIFAKPLYPEENVIQTSQPFVELIAQESKREFNLHVSKLIFSREN